MKEDRLAWPMILLLLTVLVPSIGMVWMMRAAVQNERAASDQRLKDAYQIQLQAAGKAVVQRWNRRLSGKFEQSFGPFDSMRPAGLFAALINQTGADSVLICGPSGEVLYPESREPPLVDEDEASPQWKRAQELEFESRDDAAAAQSYSVIADQDVSAVLQARARQARVRCLLRLGQREAAIEALMQQRDDVHDLSGRSFAAAAELRLLGLLDRDTAQWNDVAQRLASRLADYDGETMASSQRRFLMTQLLSLTDGLVRFPTQDAEKLAADAIEGDVASRASASMRLTTMRGVWCQRSAAVNVVFLFRTTNLRKQFAAIANEQPLPHGAWVSLIAPDESQSSFVEVPLGESMGDWRLGIQMPDDAVLHARTQQRNVLHAWIACLVVVVTGVLAWLLNRTLRRRLKLAQLKNDLVATVSHELKTPLASIRLLVDTLLDSEDGLRDEESCLEKSKLKTREYLQLISHENARLTRLIDSFLTFSRIEGGMQGFNFEKVNIRDVIKQATHVFREHQGELGSSLKVDAGEHCWISGDMDLLVTAVVNLLENAWKYSDQDRQITLRVDLQDNQVAISVCDNGIGMSPYDAKRVFERFYQIDQTVARTRGGCGLGLSIVRAIVDAHGGTARVTSQLDVGSTFTLLMPQSIGMIENSKAIVSQEQQA